MDSVGTVIDTDDDGAGGLNAKINFLATEGSSYYIVCKGYKSDIDNQYNLIIN